MTPTILLLWSGEAVPRWPVDVDVSDQAIGTLESSDSSPTETEATDG